MADHQTKTPAAPTPTDTTIVQPRTGDTALATAAEAAGTPDEKAAREAKERMAKTAGFWNRATPKKEGEEASPKTPPKKEDKPAAAAHAEPTEEPEPKPDKKPRRRKEPEIDPLELARATGQEIGREMAKAQSANTPRGTPAHETQVEPELPDEYRNAVPVFKEMARLDSKKYGNLTKQVEQYAKAESEYIAQWQKEHSGEAFDGDSDEHDGFYAKIRPNYDENDFKTAERSLIEQDVEKKVLAKMQSREAETEQRRERAAEIQPEVDRDMFGVLGDMIREVDPANKELAKDWASIQSIDEKNPLLSDVMVHVHNETKPVMVSAVRLFRSVESPNPTNPVHQRVFDVIAKGEEAVSRLPIKERYDDDGRLFATQEDYAKMNPADKARHWFIGERETIALIRGQAIQRTKSIYEQKSQEIARYTGRTNASQPSNQPPKEKPDTPPQKRVDNGSPSVGGRGTLPGDAQPANNGPKTGRDFLFSRLLSA